MSCQRSLDPKPVVWLILATPKRRSTTTILVDYAGVNGNGHSWVLLPGGKRNGGRPKKTADRILPWNRKQSVVRSKKDSTDRFSRISLNGLFPGSSFRWTRTSSASENLPAADIEKRSNCHSNAVMREDAGRQQGSWISTTPDVSPALRGGGPESTCARPRQYLVLLGLPSCVSSVRREPIFPVPASKHVFGFGFVNSY